MPQPLSCGKDIVPGPNSPAAKRGNLTRWSIVFFWSHLKAENVYFKNLPGAALAPLSIFFYLMIFLPFGIKSPKKLESPFFFISFFLGPKNKIIMLL